MADEKEQPAPTVTSPTKILEPELLLSMIVLVPDWVSAPPAVKFEVLKLIDPVPDTVIAPVNVTEPVVFAVIVPATVEAPETESVFEPVKFNVDPELTVSVVIETAVETVTLLANVTTEIFTADGPLMV